MIPRAAVRPRRAVFVDRDGVINEPRIVDRRPYPPAGLEDLRILPGVADALHALRADGFLIVVVTNQPDVARGTQAREIVEAMHARLLAALPIDAIEVCYHDDADRCACRKPLPGLLTRSAEEQGVELAASYMIGDRWRDIEAGRAAGCTTVLVERQYAGERRCVPDVRVGSLKEAAEWILTKRMR